MTYAASLKPPPARSRSLTRMPGSSGYSPGARTCPPTRTTGSGVFGAACASSSSMSGSTMCSRPVSRLNTYTVSRGSQRHVRRTVGLPPCRLQVRRHGLDFDVRRELAPNQHVVQIRHRLDELGSRQQVGQPHALTPLVEPGWNTLPTRRTEFSSCSRFGGTRKTSPSRTARLRDRRSPGRRPAPSCHDSARRARASRAVRFAVGVEAARERDELGDRVLVLDLVDRRPAHLAVDGHRCADGRHEDRVAGCRRTSPRVSPRNSRS